jgi:hypothetical protein
MGSRRMVKMPCRDCKCPDYKPSNQNSNCFCGDSFEAHQIFSKVDIFNEEKHNNINNTSKDFEMDVDFSSYKNEVKVKNNIIEKNDVEPNFVDGDKKRLKIECSVCRYNKDNRINYCICQYPYNAFYLKKITNLKRNLFKKEDMISPLIINNSITAEELKHIGININNNNNNSNFNNNKKKTRRAPKRTFSERILHEQKQLEEIKEKKQYEDFIHYKHDLEVLEYFLERDEDDEDYFFWYESYFGCLNEVEKVEWSKMFRNDQRLLNCIAEKKFLMNYKHKNFEKVEINNNNNTNKKNNKISMAEIFSAQYPNIFSEEDDDLYNDEELYFENDSDYENKYNYDLTDDYIDEEEEDDDDDDDDDEDYEN